MLPDEPQILFWNSDLFVRFDLLERVFNPYLSLDLETRVCGRLRVIAAWMDAT
jgi:hypothetical protein